MSFAAIRDLFLGDDFTRTRPYRPQVRFHVAAALHLARTVCRRAERRMVAMVSVEVEYLAYMNRLSDLLFVLTRVVNKRAGRAEVEW